MDKVEELRNKLREERNRIREEQDRTTTERSEPAGNSNGAGASSTATAFQLNLTDVSRSDERRSEPATGHLHAVKQLIGAIDNTQREPDNRARVAKQGDYGAGSTGGRFGENNSQDRSDGDNVSTSSTGSAGRKRRTVGNLETFDPIPPRLFTEEGENARSASIVDFQEAARTAEKSATTEVVPKRGRGRPRKSALPQTPEIGSGGSPTVHIKQPDGTYKKRVFKNYEETDKFIRKTFLQGPTLSKSEALELEVPLLEALQREFELVDKVLWNYAKDTPRGQLEQPIWSDIKDEDMKALTSVMLKLGQKSPTMAATTRVAVDGSDYVTAGLLIAPRFQATVGLVRETRQYRQKQRIESGVEAPNLRQRLRTRRSNSE